MGCYWDLCQPHCAWWRNQMETFSALLALCAGNSPVTGEFPAQRPVTRSFDVFFDLRPNKGLRKHPWGWWFETLSWSLWRHCNGVWSLFNRHSANSISETRGCRITQLGPDSKSRCLLTSIGNLIVEIRVVRSSYLHNEISHTGKMSS